MLTAAADLRQEEEEGQTKANDEAIFVQPVLTPASEGMAGQRWHFLPVARPDVRLRLFGASATDQDSAASKSAKKVATLVAKKANGGSGGDEDEEQDDPEAAAAEAALGGGLLTLVRRSEGGGAGGGGGGDDNDDNGGTGGSTQLLVGLNSKRCVVATVAVTTLHGGEDLAEAAAVAGGGGGGGNSRTVVLSSSKPLPEGKWANVRLDLAPVHISSVHAASSHTSNHISSVPTAFIGGGSGGDIGQSKNKQTKTKVRGRNRSVVKEIEEGQGREQEWQLRFFVDSSLVDSSVLKKGERLPCCQAPLFLGPTPWASKDNLLDSGGDGGGGGGGKGMRGAITWDREHTWNNSGNIDFSPEMDVAIFNNSSSHRCVFGNIVRFVLFLILKCR
jgi:hypothetical protein